MDGRNKSRIIRKVSATRKYNNQAIRQLRKTIGDTQKEFARRVGYSEDFVFSVESGRCNVSEEFLNAVRQATGAECIILPAKTPWMPLLVSPVQFVKWDKVGKKGKTLKKYTEKDFQNWQTLFDGTEESGRAVFRTLQGDLELMFMAAGKAKRHAQLWNSLDKWMEASRQAFHLEPHIKGVLRYQKADVGSKPSSSSDS